MLFTCLSTLPADSHVLFQERWSIRTFRTCKLRFADDIDLVGGSNSDLRDLTNRLVDRATAYGLEVSIEKSKIMTNSTNNVSADIRMNGQKL